MVFTVNAPSLEYFTEVPPALFVKEIAKKLCAEYEIDEATAVQSIEAVVAKLREIGFIEE